MLRDGSLCTTCNITGYANSTLTVTVPGFSTYEVMETPTTPDPTPDPTPNTGGSSGGSGGGGGRSGGGGAPPAPRVNATANTTQAAPQVRATPTQPTVPEVISETTSEEDPSAEQPYFNIPVTPAIKEYRINIWPWLLMIVILGGFALAITQVHLMRQPFDVFAQAKMSRLLDPELKAGITALAAQGISPQQIMVELSRRNMNAMDVYRRYQIEQYVETLLNMHIEREEIGRKLQGRIDQGMFDELFR